jgi:hypothetical protein
MRNLFSILALAGIVSAAGGAANAVGEVKTDVSSLSGDYVEARTASVFAGACHYNGELTTTGRDAEMVWHVRSGGSQGVDVSGLTAIAAITGSDNLKDESVPRRTVLFIDDRATGAQMKVLAGMLMTSYKGALGKIVAIKSAPITFARTGESFRVEAKGVGNLVVDAMPNRECCKQPNLVWYRPLVEVADRKVGFTRESGIDDSTLGVSWTKLNQNTAFYGTFTTAK